MQKTVTYGIYKAIESENLLCSHERPMTTRIMPIPFSTSIPSALKSILSFVHFVNPF